MKKIVILLCALWCAGCGDFLDERSQDLVYASSCADLDEILIGDAYMNNEIPQFQLSVGSSGNYFPWLWVMDDDVEEFNRGTGDMGSLYLRDFYRWAEQPFNVNGVQLDDYEWERLYKHISATNVVLDLVGDFDGDSENLRNRVAGEAYFLRGLYYFLLANMYSDPYQADKANETPGVPLKTTSYMEDLKFFRTRHDTLYNHIAEDLMQAGLLLQGQNEEEKFRASSDAAWALLSRVRLYMGDWEQVVAACDMVNALDRRLELLTENYNADFIRVDNPEIIFMSGSFCMRNIFGYLGGWMYRVSDDFLSLFGENEEYEDLRETAWLTTNFVSTRYVPAKVRSGMSASGSLKIADAVVIRYAEVLLNKAEALVMLDREEEAVAVLEELLKNRYKDGKCPAITARGEELMDFIRTERRKELCFEGHRWFDLRRYAVNPKYPLTDYEIVHKVYDMPSNSGANQIGTARLKMFPEGKSWTLQIPAYEININPDIEINVRTDAEYVEL